MNTPEIVSEKLDKLAVLGTPDAIAMELEAQGIKADCGGAFTCAIARYLGNPSAESRELTDGTVAVCPTYVSVYRAGTDTWRVPVPRVVGEFIVNFDQTKYPALIAEDERPWEAL